MAFPLNAHVATNCSAKIFDNNLELDRISILSIETLAQASIDYSI